MSTAQLQAMRAGREAQLERDRKANLDAKDIFLTWVREEATAHRRLQTARNSGDSAAVADAQAAYNTVLRNSPRRLPPDSAWS